MKPTVPVGWLLGRFTIKQTHCVFKEWNVIKNDRKGWNKGIQKLCSHCVSVEYSHGEARDWFTPQFINPDALSHCVPILRRVPLALFKNTPGFKRLEQGLAFPRGMPMCRVRPGSDRGLATTVRKGRPLFPGVNPGEQSSVKRAQ